MTGIFIAHLWHLIAIQIVWQAWAHRGVLRGWIWEPHCSCRRRDDKLFAATKQPLTTRPDGLGRRTDAICRVKGAELSCAQGTFLFFLDWLRLQSLQGKFLKRSSSTFSFLYSWRFASTAAHTAGFWMHKFQLSWDMLCHVEAICLILFGHVVGFASRNSRTKILSGFLPAMLAPLGRLGSPCYVGSVLGVQLRHRQKPPQTIPQKRSPPWPSRRNRRNPKNQPKNKISSKTLIPMAGKPKRNQKSPKNTSPKS